LTVSEEFASRILAGLVEERTEAQFYEDLTKKAVVLADLLILRLWMTKPPRDPRFPKPPREPDYPVMKKW
jgi:hypothetical protein